MFRKVVNISSVSGTGGNAGQVNYASAKAAVIGMTRALAKEWGRYRVNVNCVAFGFIRTAMTQPLAADGVYLFCSPESNYVSGQVLTVGGGIVF